MPDVDALTGTPQPFTFSWQGAEFSGTYHLGEMTGDWVAELRDADQGGDVEKYFVKTAELVETWDVEKKGKVVPLKVKEIKTLPFPLIMACIQGCQRAANRTEEQEKNALSGSSSRRR